MQLLVSNQKLQEVLTKTLPSLKQRCEGRNPHTCPCRLGKCKEKNWWKRSWRRKGRRRRRRRQGEGKERLLELRALQTGACPPQAAQAPAAPATKLEEKQKGTPAQAAEGSFDKREPKASQSSGALDKKGTNGVSTCAWPEE